jgi:alpha-beta hydrolase superfamily lysophospholipase
MERRNTVAGIVVVSLLAVGAAMGAARDKVEFAVRGKRLTVTIYRPAGPPKGTIVMGSGDVGWVGLAASLAEELSAAGYVVAGVNTREYLSSFTEGTQHLAVRDVPADFHELIDLLRRAQLLHRPVVLSGVSEGAALAVLAASDPKNHAVVEGVITMGLPPTAELAWRWTDIGSWITKRDANEPSFAPETVIAAVAPVPLVMIQSKKDEYVTEADYRRFLATARDPKELVLIDASNHRFTDRRAELSAAYRDALAWIAMRAADAGMRK